MNPEDELEVADPADFTPWPRPIPLQVLGAIRKVLLVAVILIGVHQLIPTTTLGSSLSSTFTLLLMLSWLAPVARVLTTRPWARKSAEE
jgi:hypothetical protein